jgi:hypothetical protein
MADRNRAIGHVIGMQERGEADLGLVKMEDKTTRRSRGDTFKPYGIEASDERPRGPTPLFWPSAPPARWGRTTSPSSGTASPRLWSAKDPLLAQLMRGADSPGQHECGHARLPIRGGLERTGIVVNPDFPTRVQLRHQMTAFIADPLHPPPFFTWLRGIGHVLKQDEFFQDATAKGAMGVAWRTWTCGGWRVTWTRCSERPARTTACGTPSSTPWSSPSLSLSAWTRRPAMGYTLHAADQGDRADQGGDDEPQGVPRLRGEGHGQIANWMATIVPFFRPHILGLKQALGGGGKRPPAHPEAAPSSHRRAHGGHVRAQLHRRTKPCPTTEVQEPAAVDQGPILHHPRDRGRAAEVEDPPELRLRHGRHGQPRSRLRWPRRTRTPSTAGRSSSSGSSSLRSCPPSCRPPRSDHEPQLLHGPCADPRLPGEGQRVHAVHAVQLRDGKALSRALGPPGLNVANFSPIQFDQYVKGWAGSHRRADPSRRSTSPMPAGKKPWELADIPFVGSFIVRNPGLSTPSPFRPSMEQMDA